MHLRRLCVALCVAVAAFPSPAHASIADIQVASNKFTPAERLVVANDTIRFTWAQGTHRIAAYSGITLDTGNQTIGYSMSFTFQDVTGGVLKYRCLLHSSLSAAYCDGMCGVLSDHPVDLVPPSVTITEPVKTGTAPPVVAATPGVSSGGLDNPVYIRGSATDTSTFGVPANQISVFGIVVRVYDIRSSGIVGGTSPKEFNAACTGCGTSSAVTWSVRLNLLPGSYVVEAIGADSWGNIQRTPPRVSFLVA